MANAMEAVFMPILGSIVIIFAIMAVSATPQAKTGFKDATDAELAKTKVPSLLSTFFSEENNKGIENYKSVSYQICQGSGTHVSTTMDTDYYNMGDIVEYFEIRYSDIPSIPECSGSSYTSHRFLGADGDAANFYYGKKIPVLGGEVVDARVVYEVK